MTEEVEEKGDDVSIYRIDISFGISEDKDEVGLKDHNEE